MHHTDNKHSQCGKTRPIQKYSANTIAEIFYIGRFQVFFYLKLINKIVIYQVISRPIQQTSDPQLGRYEITWLITLKFEHCDNWKQNMNRSMTKPLKWPAQPAKS